MVVLIMVIETLTEALGLTFALLGAISLGAAFQMFVAD